MTTIKGEQGKEIFVIAWNDDRTEIRAYSQLDEEQYFHTILTEVDKYEDKGEWETILNNNGINIEI